jgi:sulfur-carrier protein
MNTIKILAFGMVKDIFGCNELSVNEVNNLAELKEKLNKLYPKLAAIKDIQFAVNEEYVADYSKKIQHNDVVAIIPPVSGG